MKEGVVIHLGLGQALLKLASPARRRTIRLLSYSEVAKTLPCPESCTESPLTHGGSVCLLNLQGRQLSSIP